MSKTKFGNYLKFVVFQNLAEHKKTMRRFTLFTLLYLAAGVCLTVFALQHLDMTPNVKTILLVDAGLLYLFAVFTTFPFWHQFAQRSQARLSDKPAWQKNFVAIAPWFLIVSVVVSAISNVMIHPWATETTVSVSLGLTIILLSVENLFVRNQIHQ
ncbi:MAG: hypothetical protein V7L14_19500 [Nostoc sp.]|uniref:hypothetical protein n=1 Tax=Nostoc sp. TaxID=1180 RepID=UPI002FFB0158